MANAMKLNWKKKKKGQMILAKMNEGVHSSSLVLMVFFFSLLLSIHTHTRHPEKTKQVANRGREREKGLHVIANGF